MFLSDRVANYTNNAQTPRYGKLRDPRYDRGDFVFALPLGARGKSTSLVADPAPEVICPAGSNWDGSRCIATRVSCPDGGSWDGTQCVVVFASATAIVRSGEMVAVPAGRFSSGCNDLVDRECDDDERPTKQRHVDAFRIDRTEVTVAEYAACVDAGACTVPNCEWGTPNWGRTDRADHPINCVSWDQAEAYCEWVGKRLPTEWEWEKAARGTDGRKYPWGDGDPGRSSANLLGYEDGYSETAPVGNYAETASPYGALDMAGNVWEWTATPVKDARVYRGGSWSSDHRDARASNRWSIDPAKRYASIGVRCAR